MRRGYVSAKRMTVCADHDLEIVVWSAFGSLRIAAVLHSRWKEVMIPPERVRDSGAETSDARDGKPTHNGSL